ncbi:MAG TPA: hypothetical protein VG650_09710 [Mycobacteriales bacterium]|nr:hypothetical protein [Mycobacteriales bacterium]
MSGMLISIDIDEASDSWGFVGVVKVGEAEAYRTLEAFPSVSGAEEHAQALVAGVLGELLAGQEWRHVKESKPHDGAPTRKDFRLGSLFRQETPVSRSALP